MKKALLLLALAFSCLSAQTDQIVKVDRSTVEDANLNAISPNPLVVEGQVSSKTVEDLEAQKQAEAKIKIAELIETLADGDVNALTNDWNTLLHQVVALGWHCDKSLEKHCIQELIKVGADVNAQDSYGFTVLDYAEGDSIELLKQNGAQYQNRLTTITPERMTKALPYFLAGVLIMYGLGLYFNQNNIASFAAVVGFPVLIFIGFSLHWIKYLNFFAIELGMLASCFYHLLWQPYRNIGPAQQLIAAAAPQIAHHAAPLLAGVAAFVHRRDLLSHDLAARGA